ncbi:TonB-dependent receptor [Weeksellaceae bacterium TAE3-ERU29]|nr:TonB-dependent receptor [Weeksellaceae bacterium TAE3-ERU29]
MKLYTSILMLCMFTLFTYAQETTIINETALVRGNCETCKGKIEKAVRKEPSAQGSWSIKDQILTFSYDPNLTSKSKILKRIAEVGYDNEEYRAPENAYKNLPGCCQYSSKDLPLDKLKKENSPFTVETNQNDAEEHTHHMNHSDSHKNENDFTTDNSNIKLSQIEIKGNKAATSIDKKGAGLTFNIDKGELLKAACCNLSESFETNATVDVSYANAVTGTKQIKMLGLDQKYTLISTELLPEVRGLSSAYGMGFIPGRWISGIQLTKGGSSVTNGYESISGQINTEFFKSTKEEKTSINLFGDLSSRVEGNLVHTDGINNKWSQSFLVHGNAVLERQDKNNDGFIDTPVGKQINLNYLLDYNDLENSGLGTHFGINVLNDNRTAGQMDFYDDKEKSLAQNYGVGIDISRFQAWNKTGYIFKGKPYQSIGFMNKYTHYKQNSFFGNRVYNGTQNTYYSNLIFESILGNTNHKYKTGASFLYDDYQEFYQNSPYNRTEKVPGLFYEYTYSGMDLTVVAGVRVDFHNLAGTQFTPRLNVKYNLGKKTTLRASGGRGFRTANIFAESQTYLASNRKIEVLNNNGKIYGLNPEIAWNYGISLQQDFRFLGRKSTLIADFFRTDFENQILPDLDASTHKILFYNMKDSYANSLQIQWDFQPIRNLDVRVAYKNYDTKALYLSGKKEIPFTAKDRAFLNVAYKTNSNNWTFDTTLQWVGKQRLPNSSTNPKEFQWDSYSKPYFLLNAQVAHQFNKQIRLYSGAENILSYQQDQPIIDVKNPFGNYFDGGMVYAPIMPVNIYVGLDIDF